jgi:hypothetical protein
VETFGGTRVYMNKIFILNEYPDFTKSATSMNNNEEFLLKSPGYNVDLDSFSRRPISPIKQQQQQQIVDTSINEDRSSVFETPVLRRTIKFERDKKIREAEDFINNFTTANNDRIVPKQQEVPSLIFDSNMSSMSMNEISASPLVSLSFHGMKANDSFYRPPPRTGINQPKPTSTKQSNSVRERPKATIENQVTAQQETNNINSSIPLVQHTVKGVDELEQKLNNLSYEVSKLSKRSSPSKKQEPSIHSESSMISSYTNNDEQVKQLVQGMQDCIHRTKEIHSSMLQISERVSILEESNVLPFINDQKNVVAELRKDVDNFKERFSNKLSKKLRLSMEQMETKIARDIETYVNQMVEQRMLQLNKEMNVQIADIINKVKLVHPDNKRIDEYNEKVRCINKKTVSHNNNPSTRQENQQLYLLQKQYPTSIQPGDGSNILNIQPEEVSKPIAVTQPAKSQPDKKSSTNAVKSLKGALAASGASQAKQIQSMKEHIDERSKRLSNMRRAMKTTKLEG